MQPNSPEWLEFRKDKIGASDANIIMGVSEYSTILDLYLSKKGLPPRKKESDTEFIASKGHWLEDKIRAEYEFETGCQFPAVVCVHEQIPYLMASMDGKNDQYNLGIEIKYVGQELFSKVEKYDGSGEFPLPQYYPQIQHQYLCSGVVKIALIATTEAIEMEVINGESVPKRVDNKLVYILNEWGKKTYKKVVRLVPVDMDYIKNKLIPAVVDFQANYIDKNIEPSAGDSDIIEIKNLEVGKKVTEYKKINKKVVELKAKLKPLEKDAKEIKTAIFKMEMVNLPKMTCKGMSLSISSKTGSTDYESAFNSMRDNLESIAFGLDKYETMDEIKYALTSLRNMDLCNFKTANTTTYKITVLKPKKEKEDKNIEIIPENIINTGPENVIIEPPKTETKKKTVAEKKAEWDAMTSEQQTITGQANGYKTEKGKTPRGWHDMDRSEKINYLRKLAKRKDTHPEATAKALELVTALESI